MHRGRACQNRRQCQLRFSRNRFSRLEKGRHRDGSDFLSTCGKGEAAMKKVLITGAGTGFGHEAAMRLAEKGFDVIATVEIWAQVQTLKRQAAKRGVNLKVE